MRQCTSKSAAMETLSRAMTSVFALAKFGLARAFPCLVLAAGALAITLTEARASFLSQVNIAALACGTEEARVGGEGFTSIGATVEHSGTCDGRTEAASAAGFASALDRELRLVAESSPFAVARGLVQFQDRYVFQSVPETVDQLILGVTFSLEGTHSAGYEDSRFNASVNATPGTSFGVALGPEGPNFFPDGNFSTSGDILVNRAPDDNFVVNVFARVQARRTDIEFPAFFDYGATAGISFDLSRLPAGVFLESDAGAIVARAIPAPEPPSLGLVGTALGLLAVLRRRRRAPEPPGRSR